MMLTLKKTCLYYLSCEGHNLKNLLAEFIGVQPRYTHSIITTNCYRTHTPNLQKIFALYLLTFSRIYEPKVIVNTRIVLVGASQLGLAFLETLSLVTGH